MTSGPANGVDHIDGLERRDDRVLGALKSPDGNFLNARRVGEIAFAGDGNDGGKAFRMSERQVPRPVAAALAPVR